MNLNFKPWDIAGDPEVKNWPANAGDTVLIPGPERSHVPRSNYPVCRDY